MDERSRLTELLRRHGLRTSKGLGQHFLIDEEVLHTIAHAVEPDANSNVVEIGSGAGNLTLMLALSGAQVMGLEVDTRFTPLHSEMRLTNSAMGDRLSWTYMDALDFDYAAAAATAHAANRKFLIAGNIPYQITSPLIMHILETATPFDCMVLMMQREVAERLAATPGGKKSGSISIKVQYYCEIEPVIDVPPESFLPPPEVHSRVMRFRRRPDTLSTETPAFFRLVDAGFMYRRKTLANAISSGGLGYSRAQVETALTSLDFPAAARAEQLGVADYINLANELNHA